MFKPFAICAIVIGLLASCAVGQDHRVEVIKDAPEVEGLSKEMAAMLPAEGLTVVRGTSRTVCEIWPCKQWKADPDFKATRERLYPFEPGQLIGFLRFNRRGKDFRDQTINSGWYSLRYGLQPIDGNHVGTSPTRDFLLMVRAEDDPSPESRDMEELLVASAEAAESAHPAMLCLQRTGDDVAKTPVLRHDEDNDWWILDFTGTCTAGDKKNEQAVALVVVGHASE